MARDRDLQRHTLEDQLACPWLVTLLGGVVDDSAAQIVQGICEPVQLKL